MTDLGYDQEPLIGEDRGDPVFGGDVGGGDDGELVPGNARAEADVPETAARDRAANGDTMNQAGKAQVAGVARLPRLR